MGKKKTKIPDELSAKCHAIIHTAAVTSAAAGAIPIPVADALPIGAVQITMIISLGKVFGHTIGKSTAEAIVGVSTASTVGRFTAAQLLKIVPGIGSVVGAGTAAVLTETLGWIVAKDFYKLSVGKSPEKLTKAISSTIDYFNKANKLYKK